MIDFDNRTYAVDDGVMHINPAVLEQAKEDTKITSNILPRSSATRSTKGDSVAVSGQITQDSRYHEPSLEPSEPRKFGTPINGN